MPSGIEITTVMILLRHSRVEEAHKTELKKEMLFFSGVTLIDPQLIRWNTIAPVQSGHAGYHRARDRRSAAETGVRRQQALAVHRVRQRGAGRKAGSRPFGRTKAGIRWPGMAGDRNRAVELPQGQSWQRDQTQCSFQAIEGLSLTLISGLRNPVSHRTHAGGPDHLPLPAAA